MFSYLSPEQRVRKDHPLRVIRRLTDEALQRLSRRFDQMYSWTGRPSIPPEKLLRALLLQILYTIRSERLLMEQLDYNLLFRWFVGLNMDDAVWDATVFSKNRDRLLEGDVAEAQGRDLLSDEHFTVDGTLVEVLSSSVGAWQTWPMKRDTLSYHGYRFPPDIISHAVWLYHRFGVSFRDVEDLLAQRGITVSYEAIRLWCLTFGSVYARRLKRRQGRLGDIWHLDEVFVTIQGQRRYLWRAVDQDGDVIDILVQSRRDCRAATRFFRKLLKGQERTPGRLVTDKLSSYRAAHRAVMLSVAHRTDRYENNRAEVSHQPTRQRERQMRRFKSPGQAQRFLSVHGLVRNLFRVGRHLVRAVHHRELRGRSFLIWDAVTIAA